MAGSDGQVYSRTKYKGFGRKEYVDWYPLKGHATGKGYMGITMSHENNRVSKTVHRLICMAFHRVPPFPSSQTRHLDGNGQNNLPSNLQWGTQEENWMDRKAHGRGIEGEKHPMAKLTDFQMKALKWAIETKLVSQHRAARILGMSQAGISAVVHRQSLD
ncbi:hypothetical protein LCGC14_2525920 [marine sediment metagenome]|uniref:HNH nuclease domain-containing protein n=1 Tax=marine sediment metagenome TaxID=412755 RepID=A0A0F9D6J7_9ZZZZ